MQKITFGGKEYVRASEVAKKFRYTQDYVGQLCRNKKVDARRVGRIWYVELDSVTTYRKTKHKTQKLVSRKAVQKTNAAKRKKKPTARVEPVPRAKTVRMSKSPKQLGGESIPVSYTRDDTKLVPVLAEVTRARKKNLPSAVVTVEKQVAVTVPVASKKRKQTKFSSEKLPEISLSGKLSISDNIAEITPEQGEETVGRSIDNAVEVEENAVAEPEEVVITQSEGESEPEDSEIVAARKQSTKPASFTPEAITNRKFKSSTRIRLTYAVVSVAALVVAFAVVGFGAEVSVSAEQYENQLQFNLTNLQEIGSIFD